MSDPVSVIKARLAATAPAELPGMLDSLRGDMRPGVVEVVRVYDRRLSAEAAERERLERMCAAEWELLDSGLAIVAGVDEVGRGALAGPVTAGACVLPRDAFLPGLNDSKVLTPQARERLNEHIRRVASAVSVAHAQAAEIDALGMTRALALAMRRALDGLGLHIDHVLVDGRPMGLGLPSTAIVKGDSSVRAIAAAAIVAKVERDALMVELEATYPGYGFAGNKGYGSTGHLAALRELGPSAVHRHSFSPIAQPPLF